jgi:vacuolar-type H+-ATPase subunit I/STV1
MPSVKKQPHSINAILNDVIQRVNDDTQRLRVLEQSSESLTSRINGVEQGILQSRNELQKAVSEINEGITALDERLSKTENTMKEVITHMKKLVTESQMKELQSLIELYNPVKSNFVTKEEMEKFVKEMAPREKAKKSK